MPKKIKTIDFNSLPRHFDFQNQEEKLYNSWEEQSIYTYNPSISREDTFIVDTPPPTVSGSLHIGHVFSYSHTDFIVRYQRMLGKNIYYPMGWDDNGLPTERRVQNYFHVRCNSNVAYEPNFDLEKATDQEKKQIPKQVSRQNFIELCNKLTKEDEKAFKHLWKRLGLSIDWNQEYATIDKHSRKIAQMSFIDLYDKGYLYMSSKPIMWDIDFQTSIAQAEIEDRPATGNFYKIEFSAENGATFEIATTRPELLPACVGVTANPNDDRYKNLFGSIAYSPLFGVPIPIFPSDNVDMEKGTGIVMVCTFGDGTDIEWWEKNNLPLRQVLDKNGRFMSINFGSPGWESIEPETANNYYNQLLGKTIFTAKKTIVELLGNEITSWQKNIALKEIGSPIERSVKFFEKGDKPLEFIPSRQWFVSLLDKKKELLEKGNEISWHPEHTKQRFTSWTENLSYDWNISRQRYFGVPLPVWYPIEKNGTINYDKPILPKYEDLPIDPSIDVPNGFKESDRNKDGGFIGETDVFDTWFTSSVSPQINSGWLKDIERHNRLYPANIRPQSHEIIRTWAFYTIAKSLLHSNSIPWHDVLISGWVLDPNKNKMSKSKGNIITPDKLLEQYSADGVRYWAAKANMGVDTSFDESMMKIGLRLATKIYNASKFVYSLEGGISEVTNSLDKGFLCELSKLIEKVRDSFNQYDYASALDETEKFFWSNFTDSYIELVKVRAKDKQLSDSNSAVTTLRIANNTFLKLFAPFLPYITEEIWSWVEKEETAIPSVHIADFPKSIMIGDSKVFEVAKVCLQSIHKLRSENNLSLGAYIENIKIVSNDNNLTLLSQCMQDVLEAGRIKNYSLEQAEIDIFKIEIIEK